MFTVLFLPFFCVFQRVTAKDWKDPRTYIPEYNDLFPAVHSTEDPHVYVDEAGRYDRSQHDARLVFALSVLRDAQSFA